jgi:hypothetical protein
MNFYNDNLDFTGNKYNNPYALIQKAGKIRSMRRKRSSKRRKNNRIRTRKHRKK